MTVNLLRRLSYEELFDEEPKNKEEYIYGISKDIILKMVPTLISAVDNHLFNPANNCVNNWFGQNPEIRDVLLSKLKENDAIINITSSLELAEFLLSRIQNDEVEIDDSQIVLNLFKLYTLFNSDQSVLEETAESNQPSSLESYDRIIAHFIQMNLHDFDLTNYNFKEILSTQLAKSIEYFQYLEANDFLKPHLDFFLEEFKTSSWKEWLLKILPLLNPIFSKGWTSYYQFNVVEDENFQANCDFLDMLCLEDMENFEDRDFITLRSKPLIKIGSGKYRMMFILFLVEKLYKSIQFHFSLHVNKKVNKVDRIKDFRSIHCDYFSEQILLYKMIRNSFPKKWIHLSGETFKSMSFDGEPDYYLRNGNKIFLFESKDVVLKGSIKQSRN